MKARGTVHIGIVHALPAIVMKDEDALVRVNEFAQGGPPRVDCRIGALVHALGKTVNAVEHVVDARQIHVGFVVAAGAVVNLQRQYDDFSGMRVQPIVYRLKGGGGIRRSESTKAVHERQFTVADAHVQVDDPVSVIERRNGIVLVIRCNEESVLDGGLGVVQSSKEDFVHTHVARIGQTVAAVAAADTAAAALNELVVRRRGLPRVAIETNAAIHKGAHVLLLVFGEKLPQKDTSCNGQEEEDNDGANHAFASHVNRRTTSVFLMVATGCLCGPAPAALWPFRDHPPLSSRHGWCAFVRGGLGGGGFIGVDGLTGR